jgi:hypothetical protein
VLKKVSLVVELGETQFSYAAQLREGRICKETVVKGREADWNKVLPLSVLDRR